MRRFARLVVVLLVTALTGAASAHGLQAVSLEIVERGAGASVHLRVLAPDESIRLEADPACALLELGDARPARDRVWQLDCPGGLEGRALVVRGLGPTAGSAVVWVARADGTTASRVLRAGDPRLVFAPASWRGVAVGYVRLGLAHIASGADHLIFLALLVVLLRRWRAVLLAESAFTLSHTVSFSATALGWIRVSSTAAEAAIALSLVLLAAEACPSRAPASDARTETTTARAAWMALAFGLVHGLGFAGGLRELGLPEGAVAPALLGFGLGVEAGQVAFLAMALGSVALARRMTRAAAPWAPVKLGRVVLPAIDGRLPWIVATYAAGSLSVYWLVERVAACLRT